jgi:hypothetical protein
MSEFTSGNVPGFQSREESEEKQVLWAGTQGQNLAVTKKVVIDSLSTDAGNSPTTTLRAGLVVAIKDLDGNVYPYDPDANDGTQVPVGVLAAHQDMLLSGVATDRFGQILVHGLLRENELVGLDRQAKGVLGGRFVFDRDLHASTGLLLQPRGVYRKAADYTVVAADHGLLFLATAAVNFTLPTKAAGLAFRFLQTADAQLRITGASDLVHKGNASATTVTFGTSSEKIGSHVLVECVYTATNTLKWLVSNLGGTTAAVA